MPTNTKLVALTEAGRDEARVETAGRSRPRTPAPNHAGSIRHSNRGGPLTSPRVFAGADMVSLDALTLAIVLYGSFWAAWPSWSTASAATPPSIPWRW
jgi:hypothetical protein